MMLKNRLNDGKPWHADDIELLHTMLASDTPVPIIAEKLGRTQEAVRRKAATLDRLPA